MKLTKKQKVSAGATDSLANMSVVGIYQTVEEAVTELLGELGFDNLVMKKKYNTIWVFAKSRISTFKNIIWNETFYSTCFISSITHAKVVARGEIAFENKKIRRDI